MAGAAEGAGAGCNNNTQGERSMATNHVSARPARYASAMRDGMHNPADGNAAMRHGPRMQPPTSGAVIHMRACLLVNSYSTRTLDSGVSCCPPTMEVSDGPASMVPRRPVVTADPVLGVSAPPPLHKSSSRPVGEVSAGAAPPRRPAPRPAPVSMLSRMPAPLPMSPKDEPTPEPPAADRPPPGAGRAGSGLVERRGSSEDMPAAARRPARGCTFLWVRQRHVVQGSTCWSDCRGLGALRQKLVQASCREGMSWVEVIE